MEKARVENARVEKGGVENARVEKGGVENARVEKDGVEKARVELSPCPPSSPPQLCPPCPSQALPGPFSSFPVSILLVFPSPVG